MNISSTGLNLIAKFEGLRLQPYYDSAGLATQGYGHLLSTVPFTPLSAFPPITQTQADEWLQEDVQIAVSAINVMLMGISLSQNQMDSLISFVFNVGVHAFGGSSLRQRIENDRPISEIKQAFMMWNKVRNPKTGALVVSPGLTARRQAEADLYAK